MKKISSSAASVLLLDLRSVDDTLYRQFYNIASDKRKRRADRYLIHDDAVRCIFSEALLRYAYSATGNKLNPADIYCTANGKPYIISDPRFRFSISHSGIYTAVAFSDSEIGLDIEQINRHLDRKSVSNTVFTPDERSYIYSTDNENLHRLRFTELWTAKESYLKYLGTGFRKNPLDVCIDTAQKQVVGSDAVLTGIHISEDYYISVCGTAKETAVKFTDISAINSIL
nr:4'-phosphopantetheinyl transferase superfamily protein [Clostridia bacterium]